MHSQLFLLDKINQFAQALVQHSTVLVPLRIHGTTMLPMVWHLPRQLLKLILLQVLMLMDAKTQRKLLLR